MAETQPTIDSKAIADAVATAVATAVAAAVKPIADNQKVIADTLAALPPAPAAKPAAVAAGAAGATDAAPKGLTADDVAKIVGDQLKAYQTTAAADAARRSYQADKLKDLPEVYRNQLGTDPAKFAAEEQSIRDAFKADFKAAGGTVPNVGGSAAAGGAGGAGTVKPGEMVDLSKLTPTQLIAQGLAASKPQGAVAQQRAAAAARPV